MSGDHPISAVPVLQFLVDYSTPFRTDVDRALDRAKKAATTTSTATTATHLRSAEMDTVAGDIVSQGISAQVASSPPQRRVLRGDDKNLRVLLYSGEFDLNCNTLGTQHTLENNWWRGRYCILCFVFLFFIKKHSLGAMIVLSLLMLICM